MRKLVLILVLAVSICGAGAALHGYTHKTVEEYLVGDISNNVHTRKVAQEIRDLLPGQRMNLHINTPGGDIFGVLDLINALQATKGTVNCIDEGEADSAGGIIMLFGQEVTFRPNTFVLIHMAGDYDITGKRIISNNPDGSAYTNDLIAEKMRPLIGDQEVQNMYQGKDFWFYGPNFGELLCTKLGIQHGPQ